MTQYKVQRKKQNKRKNLYNLGNPCPKVFLYKYLSVDGFCKSVENGELRFCIPSLWKDQFEKRFYEADYSVVTSDTGTHPVLYANCFSTDKENEASWILYDKNGGGCVQLRIRRTYLLNLLERVKGVDFYIGYANYDLKTAHIETIHMANITGHSSFASNFDLDSYLSLLLIKRKFFEHEHELRIFAIPNGEPLEYARIEDDYLYVNINWENIVEGILMSPQISQPDKKKVEEYGNIIKQEVTAFDLYKDSKLHNYPLIFNK